MPPLFLLWCIGGNDWWGHIWSCFFLGCRFSGRAPEFSSTEFSLLSYIPSRERLSRSVLFHPSMDSGKRVPVGSLALSGGRGRSYYLTLQSGLTCFMARCRSYLLTCFPHPWWILSYNTIIPNNYPFFKVTWSRSFVTAIKLTIQ